MTVDASRSCLGLGTCVGSATRQIVDARVLLTATAPPAPPGGSMRVVRWRLPAMRSRVYCAQPAAGGTHRAMAQREACQFTGDRGSDDIGRLAAASELAMAGAQSQLRLPSDLADRPGLLLLSEPQLTADPGWEAVGPGRLDQQPAGRAVA